MIIWLASYPRSGNTLTRQILQQVFDVPSFSRYNDKNDIAAYPETARRSGHQSLPAESWPEAYAMLQSESRPRVVKTHHPPEDGGKALYVVRHPCAAIVSFVHYQLNVRGRRFTPGQIVLGLPRGTNWGGHLDWWSPLTRPDTLVLRFEELVAEPEQQITRIAEFTGLSPRNNWSNEFDTLRRDNPAFFRSGQVDPPWEEMGAEGRRLLELVHGDWMKRLGYGDPEGLPDGPLLRQHLSASVRAALAVQPGARASRRGSKPVVDAPVASPPAPATAKGWRKILPGLLGRAGLRRAQ